MLGIIIGLMFSWEKVFARTRSAHRAMRQALTLICVLGRCTIARNYEARGEQGNLSSEYKLLSRSPWESQGLFAPVLGEVVRDWPDKLIVIGCDDK